MSDKILKALMQLFAIISNAERFTVHGRKIVETFLRQQLSQTHVQTYLEIFDEYLKLLQGKADADKIKKRVSVNSVKVLRICTEINSELDQKQKHVVLIRLIEFVYSSEETVTEQESEFLSTVANVFNISTVDFEACVLLATSKSGSSGYPVHNFSDNSPFLIVGNDAQKKPAHAKFIVNETIDGELWILNVKSVGILFARYFGNSQLTINGHPFLRDSVYVFPHGSVIRGAKALPVYYSDVIRTFLEDAFRDEINFNVRDVEFVFKNGKKGLHAINFTATSGNLIGIMGGSGAGKSTLLNILNTNLNPVKGEVTINGVNIHHEKDKLEGVIGFVPQDDLLMEDLTVFQNLFYNSRLCFGDLNDLEITVKVNHLMRTLGLYEIKDLKVGDSLHKTISGGQRKRLNIALELIRTPSVLFVDEPTSGLSSLDSENVMDLLKQLSLSGNLVFVVIHQPSSDIFKLFDKLLILDIGGYPIYYGNPIDSLIYFKTKAHYADADESECETCGNINPEQVFSIIESKVIDEFGNTTLARKFSPEEWNHFYNDAKAKNKTTNSSSESKRIAEGFYIKPSRWRQIQVFIQRDLISKLHNTQYLLINFLEAPVLAFILSYFLRYCKPDSEYVFRDNLNLPAFIFMSVIVALFMGLTVSAEEIIRDRRIVKREAFLNLSRNSYLFSKILIMFIISAIQTFSFIAIGGVMFGIQDMFFQYWLMLFSVSCFANLMGLNISASFDSAVTIYILIPLLIIPQIILSGVMVKFENLNPVITAQNRVPVIGEVMASRWAFEALAVNQFKNNKYEKYFFDVDKQMSNATFKKDFWLQKMTDKLDSIYFKKYGTATDQQIKLLKKELEKEVYASNESTYKSFSGIGAGSINDSEYKNLRTDFEKLKSHYVHSYNTANAKKDAIVKKVTKADPEKLIALKNNYTNESLNDLVLNRNDFELIVESDNELVQRYHPVFMDAPRNSFIRSQFYVSRKSVFGQYFPTYFVNLVVIWIMTSLLTIALCFDALKKLLDGFGIVFEKIKLKRS